MVHYFNLVHNNSVVHWGPSIRTTYTEVDSLIRTLKVRISESVQIVGQYGWWIMKDGSR